MNDLKITFDGNEYQAKYNNQTGYYELELQAPETGGVYPANITFTDLFGTEYQDTLDVQVLTKPKMHLDLNKVFMWIFDWRDFSVKDIVEISDYEINIDEETNSNSIIKVLKKTTATANDIVVVKKNNEMAYWGVIQNISNEDGKQLYEYLVKYITNVFNQKIVLENEDLIKTTGIEDFIASTIANNFISNKDTFVNRTYLQINVLTHTTKQISVSNVENGVYNLHTWMTNCTQNYDIVYSFSIVNKKLVINIENKTYGKELIDIKAQAISNYKEVFETDIVSKVVVVIDYEKHILELDSQILEISERASNLKEDMENGIIVENGTEEYNKLVEEIQKLEAIREGLSVKATSGEYYYVLYLLNDRTTTTDMTNTNRAFGRVETVFVENYEDATQTALDVIKSNSYNHNITFNLCDRLIKVGTPIAIKTKESLIFNTYISAIKITPKKFIEYQCGNIRINFIEKLLKERKK